jgi:hypothetical protein
MIQVFATAVTSGVLAYVWLSVLGVPVVEGLRRCAWDEHGDGWRAAAVTLGVITIAILVPVAALILAASYAPAATIEALASPAAPAGLQIGVVVWCSRVVTVGLPRLTTFEAAITLAASALSSVPTAERLERPYGTAGVRVATHF